MSKYVIVGTMDIRPGCWDEVLQAAISHRTRCLRDEAGTLQFDILIPEGDRSKLLLYEVYADAAAFAVHFEGPSMKQIREELAGKVLGLTGIQCAMGE